MRDDISDNSTNAEGINQFGLFGPNQLRMYEFVYRATTLSKFVYDFAHRSKVRVPTTLLTPIKNSNNNPLL